jgi:hypothetical protein
MTPTLPLAPTREPLREPRERTAQDVLLAAARYIEEHGWHGGQSWDGGDKAVCATDAIVEVEPNTALRWAAHDRLIAYLGGRPAEYSVVWSWNDAPGRTEAEVLQALRAAAQR